MADPNRFQRVERLFREAVGLAGDERARYLDEACAEDPSLRAEVEALLAEDADPLLGEPPVFDPGSEIPTPPAPEIAGFTIGRVLGAGGMGIVYEAEQQRPRRRVALKVLRPGLHTRDRLRRFELEGEFLARLTHPAIAQIHDAGTTPDHRPYFAMELIEGSPITHYAASRELSTEQRLRLFLTVCEGVQYAHQHAVIHRDLKPSNILVTDDGRVKILDFGIARATDADVQSVTFQTDTGQLLGTLPYMSPEQATGDPNAIDTRTDVYSLGLVLYEMLTGRPARPLRDLSFPDAIHAIRTSEPERLSSVDRRLRGDLETIVQKALEPEKDRRYASVAAMGDDLRRHLQSEPITARPPSAVYQLRKFARRNRALVTGVAAVIVALTLGLVATSIALGRAHAAQVRTQAALEDAQRQKRIAEAVNAFLNEDLLGAADPEQNPVDHELTVREALDRARTGIEGRFANEPLVEAAIRTTIATVYFNLADYATAEALTRRVIELREANLGANDRLTIESRELLANCLQYDKHLDEAAPMFETLLADARASLGPDDQLTLDIASELASLYAEQARYDEAGTLIQDNLDRATRVHGADSEPAMTATDTLAGLYFRSHQFDKAVPLFRRLLQAYKKRGDEPSTAATLSSLALCLQLSGKLEEAEPMAREALSEHVRIYGKDHRYTQKVQVNLGLLDIDIGKLDEAERLIREVNDARIQSLGPDHPETLVSTAMLGRVLTEEKRYSEAEPLIVHAAMKFAEVRGPDHPYTITSIRGAVRLYEAWGKPDIADRWRAKLPEDDPLRRAATDEQVKGEKSGG